MLAAAPRSRVAELLSLDTAAGRVQLSLGVGGLFVSCGARKYDFGVSCGQLGGDVVLVGEPCSCRKPHPCWLEPLYGWDDGVRRSGRRGAHVTGKAVAG